MVVPVPETAVEDTAQAFIPIGYLGLDNRCVSVLAALPSLDGFFVTANDRADIFRPACPTFDLEYPDTGVQHLVQEMNGFQVLRGHDILVVNVQFEVRGLIFDRVSASAHLYTSASIGTEAVVIEAQVTFPTHRHTQRTVTEHLNTQEFAFRTADSLFFYVAMNRSHLLHIQFARQHDDIGELRIELERFGVGDIELGGEMHLLSDRSTILHDRDIGSDDGINAYGVCLVHYLAHQRQVFGIHDRVECQIGLDTRFLAPRYNRRHIICCEIDRTAGAHIEMLNTEIDTRSSGFQRRS